MPTPWLRTNTRAIWLAMLLPGITLALGIVLAVGFLGGHLWLRIVGGVLAAAAGTVLAFLVWQIRQPRLAYDGGRLLIYLRLGPPARVPIDVVEGFLLGQGPTLLPGEANARRQATTLVIRLAERATEWANGEFHPALGTWCGGYVTIRGTWCEPLHVGIAHTLNAKLAEAHQMARQPETAQ